MRLLACGSGLAPIIKPSGNTGDKGRLSALSTGDEHEANQCAMNQSSIRGETSPEDNRTGSRSWRMIFICNVMVSKCRDELIIMLRFTVMKQVTPGQIPAHLRLLKGLLLCQGGSCKGSNVAQWSLDDLSAIARAALPASDLQSYKEVREAQNWNQLKKKETYITDFFYNLLTQGRGSNFIFRGKLLMFQKVSHWGHLGL